MATRSNRLRNKYRNVVPDFVVDLTAESPTNEVPPTMLGTSTQQRPLNLSSAVIVLEDVIDLSTPQKRRKSKNKRAEEENTREMVSEKRIDLDDSDLGLCPVCLEKLQFIDPVADRQVMSTQCGHMYCYSCITACLKQKQKCPKCSKKQTLRNIHPLYM